jgi:hypothetical protein
MNIRIESDGTVAGTRITNAETGEEFRFVQRVKWELDVDANESTEIVAKVELDNEHVEHFEGRGWYEALLPVEFDQIVRDIKDSDDPDKHWFSIHDDYEGHEGYEVYVGKPGFIKQLKEQGAEASTDRPT